MFLEFPRNENPIIFIHNIDTISFLTKIFQIVNRTYLMFFNIKIDI